MLWRDRSYVGGRTDQLMMRLIETLSGLPLIFFVIFLTVIFGRSVYLLFFAIGAVGWLTMARIVRGQTLSVRRQEFIEAAVASGASTVRILFRHIVPNVIGPVIVYGTLTVPQIVLFESFLSFLGLGVQEPHASLGTLIAEGAGEMEAAPWILFVPGAFLAVLLLCRIWRRPAGCPANPGTRGGAGNSSGPVAPPNAPRRSDRRSAAARGPPRPAGPATP